ncbi:MAG: EamA family transporter [Caulobacteraceae bacterium]
MNKRDFTLALLVVIVWGANFTVIKLGLSGVPSMLLVALRYTLTALPAIAFVKPPAIEWRYTVAYGFTIGVGQFACLFYAMEIGMPAGVASVVLQSQAFFTLIFAALLIKEALKGRQATGLAVALLGLYFIGGNAGTGGLLSIPLKAFLLTLLAAAFWGFSNIIVRYAASWAASKGEKLDMLSLVVWSSLVPPIPVLAIALMLDKPSTLLQAMSNLNAESIFAVLYLAFGATLFGYGTWSVLLGKYPANKVAPLSLLVPITGLITAQIVLGEKLSKIQWVGGLVVLLGLVTANFGLSPIKRLMRRREE